MIITDQKGQATVFCSGCGPRKGLGSYVSLRMPCIDRTVDFCPRCIAWIADAFAKRSVPSEGEEHGR